ncbi:gluconate 2-dehydrogenase subunit 3-like protein [Chitinophaga niastensis]|uniref:Gluconate 2-dehydrogenase subunit 3-like protein n=1 Tax=Chitinophaga niastensis TaxID=536980 RepID=A0A2P8HC10_CHINA|nr:gluconate 2-dehydrogenase subunit 3 family protein [Chitinophaga niastensis]PSL43756.1 gluconate 2-dehydrogenase subunit 3-like protein [Chitinophaga niastensis]
MNRRKAIGSILLLAGAGTAVISGFRFHQLYKTPDLRKLSEYRALIAALAETIIPETDTPGAKAAGVDAFIINMVMDCTSKKEQNKFIEGLDEVTAYTYRKYHRSFVDSSANEQQAVAAYFEKRDRPYKGIAGKVSHKLMGDSFFIILKKYTVMGYCTSQIGATRGLAYDYVPGKYIGCVTLQPGQKCWATD